MEENKNLGTTPQETEEQSAINFQTIYTMLVLNWQWFVLSVIVCLGIGFVYLRYTTPIYQTTAKLLIKEEENSRYRPSKDMLSSMSMLGLMNNSAGIDNEMEILKSSLISEEAINELKLHTMYYGCGTIKDHLTYQTQPINVTMSQQNLDTLESPIKLYIKNKDNSYIVKGKYYPPVPKGESVDGIEPIEFEQTITRLPAKINTKYGPLTLTQNEKRVLKDGKQMKVIIYPPKVLAESYVKALTVAQSSKTTTIAVLTLKDANANRAIDYMEALTEAYNRQANEDKNEIALRTEAFINGRLEKISEELGNTDGSIEQFKKANRVIELQLSAAETMKNSTEYDQKLIEINMQVALLNNLGTYINDEENKYQVIPSNIGLTDASTTTLIEHYNKVALERSSLLRTASDINPALRPLTTQLDDLHVSIKQAMNQAKKTLEIQKKSILSQYNKYQGQILNSPEQQRIMTEIGRQQEVQTALYTLLLEKREENSISLAATADKGKLIDRVIYNGKVKPKGSMIMLIALILGIGFPFGILFLIEFLRYKIDGHEDVAKMTNIPIIADVAVANEKEKTVGEIIVHENRNTMMEEIFRGMRTNLQFMLQEGEKVIMTTSSIPGEGKTFIASNLAISFALLGKKVVLIGLDIRKPRLAELFQLNIRGKGITPLLTMLNPTKADIMSQITNSNVNKNLDLLVAGPIPPNPAELVQRKQLNTIIDILKEEYDYVIIDTAPVGLVTDTLEIGRVADMTVTVVRADHTPKENIIMLSSLAADGKLPRPAIVVNGIDMSKKKHGYRYGYGKYGRYSQYGRRYSTYGKYSSYGSYGKYGNYSNSHYATSDDNSIKQ